MLESDFKIPMDYKRQNSIISQFSPSTVHCTNTALTAYFQRYLFQKFISVFKWEVPETWDIDYFTYTLYALGYVAVLKTGKYGVIPQNCTLGGYNIYYRPNYAIVANPLLTQYNKLEIGKDCEIIKLMSDYGSILDLITFYADMMSLSAESAGINLVNSKLAYVFAAKDKSSAEAFKKLYDKIASGEPAVVQDKSLLKEDGSVSWETFTQDLKTNYIAGDILLDMNKWEDKFNTDIGIPNANTDKKERMVVDEVNANNVDTISKATLWLETMQAGCEKVNNMFGLNLKVAFRNEPKESEKPVESEVKEDESDTNDKRSL